MAERDERLDFAETVDAFDRSPLVTSDERLRKSRVAETIW